MGSNPIPTAKQEYIMKEVKYTNYPRTREMVQIQVERFTVGGKPVCVSWAGDENHPAEVCEFFGSMGMGTLPVCLFTGDNLYHYDNLAVLKPCGNCPTWKDRK